MSEVEKQLERPCSCEISVTAKGDITYKVKSYGEHLGQAIEMAQAGWDLMQLWVEEKKAAAQAKAQAA